MSVENVLFLKSNVLGMTITSFLLFSKQAKHTCTLGLCTCLTLRYANSPSGIAKAATFIMSLPSSMMLQFVTIYEKGRYSM